MALKVTKTLQVQRDNNTNILVPIVTSTKPTGAECDADMAAQVQARLATAQGAADELAAVLALI